MSYYVTVNFFFDHKRIKGVSVLRNFGAALVGVLKDNLVFIK